MNDPSHYTLAKSEQISEEDTRATIASHHQHRDYTTVHRTYINVTLMH